MKRAPEGIVMKRIRWFLPILAIVVLLLVVAVIGAGAAPRPTPTPPTPPRPIEHTTLDFQEQPDSVTAQEDD